MNKLVIFTHLRLQVSFIIRHLKTKPPLLVSLVDLVNTDLSVTLLLVGLSICVVHFVDSTHLAIPSWPAHILANLMRLSFMALLTYLSVSVATEYLHVRLRTASVLEPTRLTDEAALNRIRLGVLGLNLLLLLLGMHEEERDALANRLQAGPRATAKAEGISRRLGITVGQTLASLSLNLLLRLLMWRARRRMHGYGFRKNDDGLSLCGHLLLSTLSLAAVLVVALTIPGDDDGPDERLVFEARKFVSSAIVCILLPAAFIASNRTMRHHVRKKAAAVAPRWLPFVPSANKISPLF